MVKKYFLSFALFILIIFGISSCEDPVPNDYIPQNIVEALLVVGQPIQKIHITKSLPLDSVYDYKKAIIADAEVYIYEGENEMKLHFLASDTNEKNGYYYDTNYRIKPLTTYNIKVVFPDGSVATGKTTTPDTISWVKRIAPEFQYPKDTANMPEDTTARTEWKGSIQLGSFYIYSVQCLDTLNYGIYLNPATDEPNRRIKKNNIEDTITTISGRYFETTLNAMSVSNKMPFMWQASRWFGKHRVYVYQPDPNFARWFMYTLMISNLSYRANSMEGCTGYFGSASVISDDFFLIKNFADDEVNGNDK